MVQLRSKPAETLRNITAAGAIPQAYLDLQQMVPHMAVEADPVDHKEALISPAHTRE